MKKKEKRLDWRKKSGKWDSDADNDIATDSRSPDDINDDMDTHESSNGLYTIESNFQSMTSPEENVWFTQYSQYLQGKPRKMSRIVNIYNVSRGIAEEVWDQEGMTMTKNFLQNLIQIII